MLLQAVPKELKSVRPLSFSVALWILRGALGGLFDFPIRRRKEADAIRHAREPEQADALGDAHQFVRQIERATDLVLAYAFASLTRRA
jgi:hypothetical protein